ncbi:MAG: PAS domain-containing protein [Verrucomicrobia bacterium]|nr:PAS domain-containing protein [Verrucomicrobiota bacterium]
MGLGWDIVMGLLAAGMGVWHLVWRRRCAKLRLALADERQSCSALRLQHDQVYADQQAQLQTLFNSMTEGVLVLDAAGRVQLVNQSLQRLFELAGDVRGQTLLEAFRLPELMELVRRLEGERTVSGFEMEMPGLTERWVQINASLLVGRDAAARGAILVFHDLTRIKQLENTRKEFVANVSHELRTPLSLIKGFVETLLEGAKDNPETATRFLKTIEKHTDRLTFLIEDLLTISRLEGGQILMNLQPVELRPKAQRVLDDLQARATEKGVRLQNEVPAGLSARADGDRLEQVLFNLVENAIKYGRPQGRVQVGGEAGPDGKVRLWVRDDGPGIPAEAGTRVFERFFRVDRARSRDTGGTGLGLSIVKHIVQAHGGEVSMASEEGQGTTFFFTLPGA